MDSTFPQHAKRAKQLEEAKQRDDAKAKEKKAKEKADKDAAAKKQKANAKCFYCQSCTMVAKGRAAPHSSHALNSGILALA